MSTDTLKVVNDLKEKFGIDVEYLVRMGLLPPNAAKRWLVHALYFKYSSEGNNYLKGGRTYADIKNHLSDEYGISVSSIEKIVYRGLN